MTSVAHVRTHLVGYLYGQIPEGLLFAAQRIEAFGIAYGREQVAAFGLTYGQSPQRFGISRNRRPCGRNAVAFGNI